jgi:hypothetical protein
MKGKVLPHCGKNPFKDLRSFPQVFLPDGRCKCLHKGLAFLYIPLKLAYHDCNVLIL